MLIYHHTKFNTLEKIITSKGLSFRGSYYEEFCDADYKWTKRVVSRIIEQICKMRNVEYSTESTFKPIIISFGIEPDSEYMWTKYAQSYSGVQLILDYSIVAKVALKHLDYFARCRYMYKKGRIKKFIEQTTYQIESINDIQSNLESVSALIKPVKFKKENEIRYIRAYSKLDEVNYEDYKQKGDNAFIEIVPSENDSERFVCFPKEALVGIAIGYKSSEKLDTVKGLLKDMGYDLSKVFIRLYPRD